MALKPCGKGLLLETLRYADEVRQGRAFFSEIDDATPDEELLDLATTLIDKRTAPFDANEFENRYVEALRALIDRKAKSSTGKAIIEDTGEPSRSGSNVVDLMAALKKSVGRTGSAPAKKAPAAKEPAAKKAAPAKKAAADKKAPAASRKRA